MAEQVKKGPAAERDSAVQQAAIWMYHQLYFLGIQTSRYGKRAFRLLGAGVLYLCRFLFVFYRIAVVAINRYGLRAVRMLREELYQLRNEMRRASRRVKAHQGWLALKEFLRYLGKGFLRHKKMLSDIALNFCLPIVSVIVLVVCVSHWNQLTFALQVEYKGKNLGYITDESVYHNALQIAQSRIVGDSAVLSLSASPSYTIKPVRSNALIDASALSEKLVSTVGGQVEQACGIYVDGKFLCAIKNETDIVSLMDRYLQQSSSGKQGERVEFVQEIERIQGMYPPQNLWSVDQIWKKFNGKADEPMEYTVQEGDTIEGICAKFDTTEATLRQMNPALEDTVYKGASIQVPSNRKFLQVQVTRTETFEESIPFETVEVKNSNRYRGYRQVKVDGEEGIQKVTAMVTYVDGVETKRSEISRVTVKEPVTKKIEVGTKSTSLSGLGGSYSVTPTAGRFVWPVVGLRTINSPFGYRWGRMHKGLDISGSSAYGRLILAADDGVVEYAGWHYSYGNYVVINHGGGVRTLYAHASSLGVSSGQHVSQGEAIARVGSTGYSFGAHLHFSVIINGTFVDPSPYLGL